MNEEELLKEHPSLKGHIWKPTHPVYNGNEFVVDIDIILETQIDKQKVKEAKDRLFADGCNRIDVIKKQAFEKELGLEDK